MEVDGGKGGSSSLRDDPESPASGSAHPSRWSVHKGGKVCHVQSPRTEYRTSWKGAAKPKGFPPFSCETWRRAAADKGGLGGEERQLGVGIRACTESLCAGCGVTEKEMTGDRRLSLADRGETRAFERCTIRPSMHGCGLGSAAHNQASAGKPADKYLSPDVGRD